MYACVCCVILLYEFGLLVCLDVILVTIVILTAFLIMFVPIPKSPSHGKGLFPRPKGL